MVTAVIDQGVRSGQAVDAAEDGELAMFELHRGRLLGNDLFAVERVKCPFLVGGLVHAGHVAGFGMPGIASLSTSAAKRQAAFPHRRTAG